MLKNPKKLTFKELSEEQDNSLHNSNMKNLVSLATQIKQDIDVLEQELKFAQNKLLEVNTYGESGKIDDTTHVQKLYNSYMQRETPKPRTW